MFSADRNIKFNITGVLFYLMRVVGSLISRLSRGVSRIMIAAAFLKAFSLQAFSQDVPPVIPLYGMPPVKYGPPPTATPLPMPKYGIITPMPTDVVHNVRGVEALIAALVAGALTIVFLWVGLKYFLGHEKK
jgi:hypothetical protein